MLTRFCLNMHFNANHEPNKFVKYFPYVTKSSNKLNVNTELLSLCVIELVSIYTFVKETNQSSHFTERFQTNSMHSLNDLKQGIDISQK